MTDILAWRFKLNDGGGYDIFEEHDELNNWVYIKTVDDIMEMWKK